MADVTQKEGGKKRERERGMGKGVREGILLHTNFPKLWKPFFIYS